MVTSQTLPNMSTSNLANFYPNHSTHLGYPMSKFICVDNDGHGIIGNNIEDAFQNYKDIIDDYVNISTLTFYELNNPIKVSYKLIIDRVN